MLSEGRNGLSLLAGKRAFATVLHIAPNADACAARLADTLAEAMAQASTANAVAALPRLGLLLAPLLGAPYTDCPTPDDLNPT